MAKTCGIHIQNTDYVLGLFGKYLLNFQNNFKKLVFGTYIIIIFTRRAEPETDVMTLIKGGGTIGDGVGVPRHPHLLRNL